MAAYTITFDNADEMALALEVLRGKASSEAPKISFANMVGRQIVLTPKPEADGHLLIEVSLYDPEQELADGAVRLGHSLRMDLG